MHQVWEKVVESEPSLDVQHTSFVIPKIIVETQLDTAEATAITTTITAFSPDEIATTTTNINADTPEKPLNQKMEKHSRDNGATAATTKDNNSPVMDVESSIYHYGKQQQQQQHDEQQHTSELQKFANMKISGEESVMMSHESEVESKNDDEKRHTLNDKIGEIYRKIERVEGKYYDEKEKIIDNFEKRMSSPTHQVKSADNEVRLSRQSEFELQENWNGAQEKFNYDNSSPDKQQTFNDDVVEEPAGIQPMFDSNQYASSISKASLEHDGGELQANFVEHPSSTEEMQYQQQQDYYANATGYEQQQQVSLRVAVGGFSTT